MPHCSGITVPETYVLLSYMNVNSECTLSERWVHSERTVSAYREEFDERLRTVNANVRECNVKNERTIKDMWTQDNQFIRRALGVIFILYFVTSLNMILSLLSSVISLTIWYINCTERSFCIISLVQVICIWFELNVNVTCYSFPASITGHYEKKLIRDTCRYW